MELLWAADSQIQAKEVRIFVSLLPACSDPVESRDCPPLTGRAQAAPRKKR